MSFYSKSLCVSNISGFISSSIAPQIEQVTCPSRSNLKSQLWLFIYPVYQTLEAKSRLKIIHNIIKDFLNHPVNLIGVLRLQLTHPTITHYRSILTQNHSKSRFIEYLSTLNPNPIRLNEYP